jgi:hypothetical protein
MFGQQHGCLAGPVIVGASPRRLLERRISKRLMWSESRLVLTKPDRGTAGYFGLT